MELSLYDKIGGSAAIHAAVELLYAKILADESLLPFLEASDLEEQKRKQRDFLSTAFGGPDVYDGIDITEAHAHLVKLKGLNDSHFNSVIDHLKSSLSELNMPVNIANEAVELTAGMRDDVLGRNSGQAAA